MGSPAGPTTDPIGSEAADASVAGAAVAVEVGALEVAAGGVDEPVDAVELAVEAAVAAPVGEVGLGAAEVDDPPVPLP